MSVITVGLCRKKAVWGGGGGGTSLWPEGLKKSTYEGGKKSCKRELKVRFGTLTGQIHNAGDDNDRPSH